MPRILDLYCGMGGLSLGFVLGLEDTEILGLDIDRYAVDSYNFNLNKFGAKAVVQDVLRWKPSGEYDIVMGGSPCQPFSLANTRKKGKEHPLYPTFPRFFDIVLELRPKVFLLENVKGLLTKRHKPLLLEQLDRVKKHYRIAYEVLNAAYYGVPQRRERLFVIGFRRDLEREPSFPPQTHAPEPKITLDGKNMGKWVTVREAIGDLLAIPPINYPKKLIQTNPKHGRPIDMNKPSRTVKVDGRGGDFTFDTILVPLTPEQVERIKREREDTTRHFGKMEFPDNLDKPSRTISSHTIQGSKRETIVLPITAHIVSGVRVDISNPKGFGDASKVPNKLDLPTKTVMKGGGSGGAIPPLVELPTEHVGGKAAILGGTWCTKHKPIDMDKPSYTVPSHLYKAGRKVELPIKVAENHYRRLTVRECLRLQGFPDWWGFPDNISISRKYKLVGEAVCPILAYRLAIHIGKLMGWKVKEPPKYEEWQLPYFYRAFADYFSEVSKGWMEK